MPARLIYSTAAVRDLNNAIAWLTQPGSGPRAHHRLFLILDEIRRLPDNPARHREDPDNPGLRLATVQGYAIRFYVGIDSTLFVERIFAPGQRR